MRGKKPDAIGLEPPEWVNDAGYQHHSRCGFERALRQIEDERLATPEEVLRCRKESSAGSAFPPPARGGMGSAAAVVVITTALALATIMALSVYLVVYLIGS
jgi:hypothetical protein